MPIINESWKRLWNGQEIRTMVLASLCFQFGLVFLSPLRKRTGQKLLIFLLWFFYLLADYVAILALGNLLKRQYESACGCYGGVGLGAFWAPFLLLHLGGPDTITSFSIEDNELWLRHFLALVVQVVVAFLVLLELVVIPRLRVAAALVFIAGLVKYSERTWALRSASMDQLRSSMFKSGTDYVILKEHLQGSNDLAVVRSAILEAYDLVKRTMPVVADFRLTSRELTPIQIYFPHLNARAAFELVDIELSFLYDVLHTKAILINGWRGFLWRFVTVGMIFSAFVLFIKSEKRGYAKADIIISYVLLGSALFMELISLLLIIFSDWMIAIVEQMTNSLLTDMSFIMAKVISCFSSERKHHRWSNSMGQYSLLSFSLRDKNTIIRRILVAVKLKTLWDKFIFVHSVHVPIELEDILYGQLTPMGFELKDVKGESTLELEECNYLRWSIKEECDETILLWHIATDLCFHGPSIDYNNSSSNREISLIISNYMVYLLIMQPSMMPDGIGKIRFQDTCAAVKRFYHVNRSGLTETAVRESLLDLSIMDDELLANRTWSVLSVARGLAKELNRLEEDKRWCVIRGVWVEMLGHAAINCKTYYHAKQLSQGGEFITHVYQLLAHMLTYESRHAIATRL